MAYQRENGIVTAFNPRARTIQANGKTFNLSRKLRTLRRFKPGDYVSITYDDVNGGRDYATVVKQAPTIT